MRKHEFLKIPQGCQIDNQISINKHEFNSMPQYHLDCVYVATNKMVFSIFELSMSYKNIQKTVNIYKNLITFGKSNLAKESSICCYTKSVRISFLTENSLKSSYKIFKAILLVF